MRLTDVLQKELIKIPLKSSDRDSCIEELIDSLSDSNLINDSETIFKAVIEREKIMTTGVGNGIAIPHCKHADCEEFAVTLGVKPEGIDFESIDHKPVKIVFLLIGPENNPGMHIKLLSRISRLMSNEELRQNLLDCKTAEEASEIIEEEENYFFEID